METEPKTPGKTCSACLPAQITTVALHTERCVKIQERVSYIHNRGKQWFRYLNYSYTMFHSV